MAYTKVYDRIDWVNESDSKSTPLGASNLNKMDYALSVHDERIVQMDARLESQEEAVSSVIGQASASATSASASATSASASATKAQSEAEKAKTYAENAEAVTGIEIATKERAGIVKGGDIPIDEGGVLQFTTTTTSRELTDSQEGGIRIISMDGESQQKQYSGKNLWSLGDVGGTLSVSKTFALEPAKYTISALVTSSDTNTSNCLVQIFFEDDTSTSLYFARNVRTSQTVTFSKTVRALNFYASNNYANSQDDTFSFKNIQIEEGSTMTEYEPYVGGTASPNPNFKQDIYSVEVSEIRTSGKNLWSLGNVSGTLSVAKGFKLKAGTYAISALVTSSDTDATTCLLQISCEDGTKKSLYFEKNSRKSKNVTLTSNATTFNFYASTDYSKSQGDTFSFEDIQIEKGSVATPFEEFKETRATLSAPITLRKQGDAQDILCKLNGVFSILRGVGTEVVDASFVNKVQVSSSGNVAYITDFIADKANYSTNNFSCSHFEAKTSNDLLVAKFDYGASIDNNGMFGFRIKGYDLTSYKNFITNNKITVNYELKTQTIEP